MGRRHLTDDEKLAIVEKYCNGDKMSVIALIFEVYESTVYRVCRKANVPIRWHRNCRRMVMREAAE